MSEPDAATASTALAVDELAIDEGNDSLASAATSTTQSLDTKATETTLVAANNTVVMEPAANLESSDTPPIPMEDEQNPAIGLDQADGSTQYTNPAVTLDTSDVDTEGDSAPETIDQSTEMSLASATNSATTPPERGVMTEPAPNDTDITAGVPVAEAGRASNDPRVNPKPVALVSVATELRQMFDRPQLPPVSVVARDIPRASNDPRGPRAGQTVANVVGHTTTGTSSELDGAAEG